MLLAIDVGNTNTVFALHDGTDFVSQWRIETNGRRTADEYFVWLAQLMTHHGIRHDAVSRAIVASVAPQTVFNLRVLCGRYFGAPPLVIGDEGVVLGVEARVERPAEVGADRLVNSLSAYRRYGPDLVVVDFGTATTFDVVDGTGAYVGGVIAPGVNLSLEALQQAAAKLPRVAVGKPDTVIGKSTIPAMRSGIYWGYISLIEGMCRRIADEHGKPMTVIATGGLSPLFARGTDVIDHVDQDLTMRGLVAIDRLNRETPAAAD